MREITLGKDFVVDDEKIANISGAKIPEDAPANFKSWALKHGAILVKDNIEDESESQEKEPEAPENEVNPCNTL